VKLQGIFVPIAIPFDHTGEIYQVKVRHNIEKWNRTGLAGYVVSGAESIYLDAEEKVRMWEWVAEYSAPEKILIAATGMPGVRETVRLTNQAETLGYKAALVRGPAAAADVYFRAVADQAKIPVMVDGEMPQGLSHPNILAADLGRSAATLAQDLAGGATGAVVDFANAAPYAAISIWEAHRTRETEAALDWQQRISPAVDLIAKFGVAALKCAMDLNGYYGGPPRLPLTVLTPDRRQAVEQAFDGIKG